jgi:hypothetical protein
MGWLDTSGFVRAALERLNRPSILALLQQVTSELDAHCRRLESAVEPSVLTLRQELGQQAEVLRGALDQHERELSAIGCTLRSLLAQHQQSLASLLSEVEVRECQQQLTALHLQLERVQAEAETLSEVERQQVEQLLQKALQVYDVATVNLNLKVGGSGARLRLDELLQILAGVGQLAQTDFLYQQGQEGRLSGARLLLTDETVVLFDCARHELPGSIFELVFTTASWKGLPASFRIRFAKQSHQLPMCKRALTLDQYEVLYTTNIVFDLTVRAPEPAVIEARAQGRARACAGTSGEAGDSASRRKARARGRDPQRQLRARAGAGAAFVAASRSRSAARLGDWRTGSGLHRNALAAR